MADYDPNNLHAVLATLITGQNSISSKIDDHTRQEDIRWERLEGTLAASLSREETNQTLVTTRYDKVDDRLKKLENWKYWVMGLFAVLSVVIGLMFKK